MIVDSSAVVAILRDEPEAEAFVSAIVDDQQPTMSVVSWVESAVVLDSARDPVVSRKFDEFIRTAGIAIADATDQQARLAREAYRDFGRGSGHPARLNFGDCFSYALARSRDDTLLFKGNDFNHTDIRPAVSPQE